MLRFSNIEHNNELDGIYRCYPLTDKFINGKN